MLLESIRRIIDPQARNLDISHIVGKKVSWEIVNNNLECTILAPWFKMQGPNGILAKLLQLGLEYPDGNKITILSAEEYTSQILGSCTIC